MKGKRKIIGFLIGIALLVTSPFVAQAYNIYLSDSGFQGDGTDLFSVTLSGSQANLTLLTHLTLDQVDAIAADENGIYVIDKQTRNLGYYDLGSNNFSTVGTISVSGVVLYTISSGGTHLFASQDNDSLYILNPTTAATTLVGKIINQSTLLPVDVAGCDIAFDSSGKLYLWTNSTKPSQRGLYELTIPAVPGNVLADSKGDGGVFFLTGLVSDGGTGNFLGSAHGGLIYEIDGSGGYVTDYTMYVGVNPYTYQYGDMATSAVAPVPEPATLLLVGTGLIGLAGLRRKFRKR